MIFYIRIKYNILEDSIEKYSLLKIRIQRKDAEEKYRGADLNRRPSGYESDALTS